VAAFTEGDRIALQPLRILAARKLLASVARHEFLHALVEDQSTSQTPLWLREGLVEAWAGEMQSGNPRNEFRAPSLRLFSVARMGIEQTLEAVNQNLAHAANEEESEAAHRAAGWYAQQLLNHYGRAQLLEWLRAGVPQYALDSLR
jgi:hypothetical protein